LELIKDYDLEIHYHPSKVNLIANALSRKEHVHAAIVTQLPDELAEGFEKLNLGIVAHTEGVTIEVEPTLAWSKRYERVRSVMLKFKRSKTWWQKVEVQTSQRMSRAQSSSKTGYVFLRLTVFVKPYWRKLMTQPTPFTPIVPRCIKIWYKGIGGMV
jgi:hypothetical protein